MKNKEGPKTVFEKYCAFLNKLGFYISLEKTEKWIIDSCLKDLKESINKELKKVKKELKVRETKDFKNLSKKTPKLQKKLHEVIDIYSNILKETNQLETFANIVEIVKEIMIEDNSNLQIYLEFLKSMKLIINSKINSAEKFNLLKKEINDRLLIIEPISEKGKLIIKNKGIKSVENIIKIKRIHEIKNQLFNNKKQKIN